MYKLMIVDDEYMILEGLKRLLDYAALGLEIVYTAGSGQEALAYMVDHPIDVVITDISMPGMTGLELISQLKTLSPEIDVIIMSGFQEFDYARQAVSLGVKDYLLKPINKQDLRRSLEDIIALKSQKHPFGQAFLNGKEVSLDQLKQEFQTSQVYFLASLTPLDNVLITQSYQHGQRTIYLSLARERLAEPLIFQDQLKENSHLPDLLVLVKASYFYGYSVLNQTNHLPDDSNIQGYISSGNLQGLLDSLPALRSELERSTPVPHLVKFFFTQLLRDTYQQFNKADSETLRNLYTAINQSEQLPVLLTITEEKLQNLTQDFRYNSHVKQVIDIIREEYQQELTLKLVSERLFLNAVYLGQIIKKDTGSTFSELLNQERITAAQQLLLATDENIEEICFKVGYTNIGYFYKIFKRLCGQSPKSFRSQRDISHH